MSTLEESTLPTPLSGSTRGDDPPNMASTFDDDELSMSLSGPAADRRAHRPAPPRPLNNQTAASPAAKIPNDRRTAQRIGLYDVKKTLGEGSFGKVKLATHRVSGQELALKIISRKKLISKDMAGRVEREIQYLQLLRHPHIIKLYESHDNRLWSIRANSG